jgi:hypothetical protein
MRGKRYFRFCHEDATATGCVFLGDEYSGVFRSCGVEVEGFDGALVVAGEVLLAAVAVLVVGHVVVEVAVDDDGTDLEDDLSAVGRPPTGSPKSFETCVS